MTQENLLLREDGYPHLPLPEVAQICQHCNGKKWIFRGHGEDTECEHCLDNEPFDVEALRQENKELRSRVSKNVPLLVNETLEYELEDIRQENAQLRELLCLRSSSSTHMPYMDDGELQDNSAFPCIDYKRDSVAEIISKLQQRTLKVLEANNQCRCQQLGDFCNGEHHLLCRKGGAA